MHWWDGIEQWVAGLDFAEQTIVVMPVALVLSVVVAFALDGLLGGTIRVLRRLRGADEADTR